VVGRDLEQLGGIRQAVYLVEDDPLAPMLAKEGLGILQQTAYSGQLAVEVLALGQRQAQDALADAADTHEPDD
jgi:hypothetical protein